MNETRTLARFVADTTFTDLPRRLVENLKITVLDTFGAALVGTRQPWAQRIVAVAKALGGAAEASVLHHRWRTDVSRAALANGVLVGAFECEPLTGSHASGTVLPAALAISERARCWHDRACAGRRRSSRAVPATSTRSRRRRASRSSCRAWVASGPSSRRP